MVEVHLGDLVDDLRDELDCAGAGSDDGYLLARQVVVVVPLRGVKRVAAEFLDTVESGEVRYVQRADARYEKLRDVLVTCGGPDVPPLLGVVPRSAEDGLPEVGFRVEVVLDRRGL